MTPAAITHESGPDPARIIASLKVGGVCTIVGAVTLTAAAGQHLNPDLMPGFLIYGILASILAQLWLISLAVTMLRRARATIG